MNRFNIKHALGLAVSGTEVRLAHLTSNKGQIRIEGLERAKLATTLEQQPADTTTPKEGVRSSRKTPSG